LKSLHCTFQFDILKNKKDLLMSSYMSDYKGLNCDRNVITSIKSTRRAHKEAAVMMTASEATVVSRSTEGFLNKR